MINDCTRMLSLPTNPLYWQRRDLNDARVRGSSILPRGAKKQHHREDKRCTPPETCLLHPE